MDDLNFFIWNSKIIICTFNTAFSTSAADPTIFKSFLFSKSASCCITIILVLVWAWIFLIVTPPLPRIKVLSINLNYFLTNNQANTIPWYLDSLNLLTIINIILVTVHTLCPTGAVTKVCQENLAIFLGSISLESLHKLCLTGRILNPEVGRNHKILDNSALWARLTDVFTKLCFPPLSDTGQAEAVGAIWENAKPGILPFLLQNHFHANATHKLLFKVLLPPLPACAQISWLIYNLNSVRYPVLTSSATHIQTCLLCGKFHSNQFWCKYFFSDPKTDKVTAF